MGWDASTPIGSRRPRTEDEDDWPRDRDIETFHAWFETEVHWCSVDLRPPGHEEAWFREEELNGETV